MSNLNWATAPIDATHGGNSPHELGVVTWFKDVGNGNHSFWNDGSMQSWHKGRGNLREWSLVERPKPWSGPEDGLPPVGMRFTFKGLKHRNHDYLYALKDWCAGDVVSVVAHVSLQGELSALYWNEHKMTSSTVRSDLLEPVKTPEQLAADKRETAISEIMDVADVDCRVTAARLVDAGFKREVV